MSGKTPEEIAFELVAKLKGMGVWGEKNMADILDMYAECLDAAQGNRKYIPGRCIMDTEERVKVDNAALKEEYKPTSALTTQAQLTLLQTAYQKGLTEGSQNGKTDPMESPPMSHNIEQGHGVFKTVNREG